MRAYLVVMLLVASVARAEEPVAEAERTARSKAHFDRGRAAFNLGEFDEAIREFEEGYKWRPLPLFLYNMAQAEQRAGHAERALERYRRYLVVSPRAPERKSVEKQIAALEKELAERPIAKPVEKPPEPPPPPPVETPPVEPPVETKAIEPPPVETKAVEPPPVETKAVEPPPVETKAVEPPPPVEKPVAIATRKPWHKDWLAPTLLGFGLAALAAGAGTFAVFDARYGLQNQSEQDRQNAAGAPGAMIGGTVLMVAGGALIVGSAIRWGLRARR